MSHGLAHLVHCVPTDSSTTFFPFRTELISLLEAFLCAVQRNTQHRFSNTLAPADFSSRVFHHDGEGKAEEEEEEDRIKMFFFSWGSLSNEEV